MSSLLVAAVVTSGARGARDVKTPIVLFDDGGQHGGMPSRASLPSVDARRAHASTALGTRARRESSPPRSWQCAVHLLRETLTGGTSAAGLRTCREVTRTCHLGTRERRGIIPAEAVVEFVKHIEIDAPPDVVWAVMSDGERWPEWTASVTSVKRLDKGPLRIGSRALIRQPRFPPAVWTVTTLEPGHRFVWKSGMPGMWVHGDHSVGPTGRGTRATLRLSYDGLLARVMGRLTRGITNRYLDMEASGLKQRSEGNSGRPGSVRLEPALGVAESVGDGGR